MAQNAYAVLWFKGRVLNLVFGLLLSVSRLVSLRLMHTCLVLLAVNLICNHCYCLGSPLGPTSPHDPSGTPPPLPSVGRTYTSPHDPPPPCGTSPRDPPSPQWDLLAHTTPSGTCWPPYGSLPPPLTSCGSLPLLPLPLIPYVSFSFPVTSCLFMIPCVISCLSMIPLTSCLSMIPCVISCLSMIPLTSCLSMIPYGTPCLSHVSP